MAKIDDSKAEGEDNVAVEVVVVDDRYAVDRQRDTRIENPPPVVTQWVLEKNADPLNPCAISPAEWNKRRTEFGQFEVNEKGWPLHPGGKKGVNGRGDLAYWGPNPAADPVVIAFDNKGKPFVLLVLRKDRSPDSHEWALPGGMVDPGEKFSDAALRELKEEAGVSLGGMPSHCIYEGLSGDSRDTNNAWIITKAWMAIITAKVKCNRDKKGLPLLSAGDDALKARWFPCHSMQELEHAIREAENVQGTEEKVLYAAHGEILAMAVLALAETQPHISVISGGTVVELNNAGGKTAIVTSAHPTILGGGGVGDDAVHRAGGTQLLISCIAKVKNEVKNKRGLFRHAGKDHRVSEESQATRPDQVAEKLRKRELTIFDAALPPGTAVTTEPGDLRNRGVGLVIHAVPPDIRVRVDGKSATRVPAMFGPSDSSGYLGNLTYTKPYDGCLSGTQRAKQWRVLVETYRQSLR